MVALPTLSPNISAAEACVRLAGAGWRAVGAGDWSWAFADVSDEWAARVTPFDPGYRIFARDCLEGPANRWLPKVLDVLPLLRGGYVVLMERLWPAETSRASAFCAALGIANETGADPPIAGPSVDPDEPDLGVLRTRMRRLLAEGRRRYGRWVRCDIREGNVMASRDGQLKLVDPVGVGGWLIAEALRSERADLLTDFTLSQMEDFLTIPFFGPGREGESDKDELLGKAAWLYGSGGS
jgi:hypothetical protein